MANGFLARLMRRTSIESLQAEEQRTGLRRVLGGRDLIAIGLGTMIGGGIFTTIGPGVAKAGPAITPIPKIDCAAGCCSRGKVSNSTACPLANRPPPANP